MSTDDAMAHQFEAERARLSRIASRILGDADAAEDVVQQAWLRLHGTSELVENLPGWLTTVTTRLCLDRLRLRTPLPVDPGELPEGLADEPGGAWGFGRAAGLAGVAPDPADEAVLAETVGIALQVVLDRLTPAERVAFVLHDSFGVDFALIGTILETSPAAARKLASRARAKVSPGAVQGDLGDWQIVDAFLAAAREGDFSRLLELLAPDVVVSADAAAVTMGTPKRLEGSEEVAKFFNGAAAAAFPVFVSGRPGAAWINQGEAKVAFDFEVVDGRVRGLVFRAEASVLETVRRRKGTGVSA